MAMPTSSSSTPVMQGKPPMASPAAEPPTPVVFDDIQPVYLARLYPEEVSGGMAAARGAALEAGNAARDLGMHLKASQQEPIATTAEEPAAALLPRHEHRGGTKAD